MAKFTIALVILCYLQAVFCTCLFNQCTDECPDNAPTAGQCAILFDEPKCNDDKRIVAENGGSPIPITGVNILIINIQLSTESKLYTFMHLCCTILYTKIMLYYLYRI